MNIKKTVCIILSVSLASAVIGGCSKNKEEITESLTAYLEAVRTQNYDESCKYVDGRDDYFQNEMDPMQAKIVETVFAGTEFEIGEIAVDKPSAVAEVTVIMPDIHTLENEGYNFYEYMDAVGSIDERIEQTLEFEFIKADDEWLIVPSSTEEFYGFCVTIGEGIDFGPLNEYTALAAVDSLISNLAEGNIETALAMTPYSDMSAILQSMNGLDNILTVYFSDLTYSLEVTENTDDHVTITINGTAPNVEMIMSVVLQNRGELVDSIAANIDQNLGGDGSMTGIIAGMLDPVFDNIDPASLATLDGTFIVTADENGSLIVDPQSDLNPVDISIPGL